MKWAEGIAVGQDTQYQRVSGSGQLLIFSGDELWGKVDLPLSNIKTGKDARFFTLVIVDKENVLLEDSPLPPPVGGMRLRVISRTSQAPALHVAAMTDEVRTRWCAIRQMHSLMKP